MAGPLSPLRVVELCDDLAGAYCGRQFAAWGAGVTVLEPPDGSPLRRRAPLISLPPGRPVSLLWEYLAASKDSHVFGAGSGLASTGVSSLLVGANVFVSDWAGPRLEHAGLSTRSLRERFPGLVVVTVTPFGGFGPYADMSANDLIVQALASFASFNGAPDGSPLKGPANVVAYAAGVSAFVGALAAVHELLESGQGQTVEVSCQEAVASMVQTLRAEYSGQPLPRLGGPAGGTLMVPCRDTYIAFNPIADGAWPRVLAALGIDEGSVPASLRTAEGMRDRQALTEFLASRTAHLRASDLFQSLNLLGVIAGRLNSPADLLVDEHLAARGFFFNLDFPEGGTLRFPGAPARMSRSPMEPPTRAPGLGESREGPPPGRALAGRKSLNDAPSARSRPPLAGLRIVDLAQAWMGSYATMLLAHLGADVVKIESPKRPDIWRGDLARGRPVAARNPHAHPWNTNASFNSVNRDKRSVALDLAHPAGRQAFLRMVAEADMVTENFSPRVIENLGLTYDDLRLVRPDLIMVSFSGYGRTGSYRDFKANGAVMEAVSGWSNYLGYPGQGPMMMGTMQADAITGLHMAACALVALLHRDFTGTGQYVEGSMQESAVGYIGEELLQAGCRDAPALRRGNRSLGQAPHGIFPAAEKDTWIALAVGDDSDWERFVHLTGSDALRAQKFAAQAGRVANIDEVERLVAEWTRTQKASLAVARLRAAGLMAAPVLDTRDVFEDLHLLARGWFQAVEHPDMGVHRYNGFPWRFGMTPAQSKLPAPRLGQHTREVLAVRAGLSEEQIDDMLRSGAAADVLEVAAPAGA